MRRRIISRRDAIDALRNDFPVLDDDSAEGTALAREYVVKGELNRAGHERIVHVLGSVNMRSHGVALVETNDSDWSTWTRS
jgi:hypothetical protein